MSNPTLEIQQNTFLKQTPAKQASELSDGNKHAVEAGTLLGLSAFEPLEEINANDSDNHIKVTLSTPIDGKLTWYVFQRHASIVDGSDLIYPCPEIDQGNTDRNAITTTPKYVGKVIILPSGIKVYSDQPIILDGHFSWGEATHGATRIPRDGAHEANIIKLAKQLEKVRAQFGKTIRVTSWYRPEPFNSRAGGAKFSQHLGGGAVDIVIDGFNGKAIARAVKPWWIGGIGIYPGNRQHICHLDVGAKRSWGF